MSSYLLSAEEVNEYDTLWIVDMWMLQLRLYSFLLPLSRLCCLRWIAKMWLKCVMIFIFNLGKVNSEELDSDFLLSYFKSTNNIMLKWKRLLHLILLCIAFKNCVMFQYQVLFLGKLLIAWTCFPDFRHTLCPETLRLLTQWTCQPQETVWWPFSLRPRTKLILNQLNSVISLCIVSFLFCNQKPSKNENIFIVAWT